MDSENRDTYSIGEKVDLDNDGENELTLNGPYGGIYLDARDNKVYRFAAGDGNMERFEGAHQLIAEINFSEEPVDAANPESGMNYTWNGAEISLNEYADLCSKIFAAQVDTNFQQ